MSESMEYDCIIVGAGAAGLMCAAQAGKRDRRVLLLDHAKKVGEKIRISGGGRCNFTNLHTTPANYLSQNPRFCVSALKRYTQHDFIALVEQYGISYHEKTLGQLFCDGSSQQIIDMLVSECRDAGVTIRTSTHIHNVAKDGEHYTLTTSAGTYRCSALVIATGGPSIPKMGATGWAYDIARQFGLKLIEPRAALVPFTLDADTLARTKTMAGVAVDAIASCNHTDFSEAILFTHRGMSGPAILQISSYWQDAQAVTLNLCPNHDVLAFLKTYRQDHPKQDIASALTQILPKRLAQYLCHEHQLAGRMSDMPNAQLESTAQLIEHFTITPNGTEGYRTAEVTLGGVDTDELSSKTFEARNVSGLYFIGEAIDVTGHLGGFNFQWAWSSGHACGQFV